MQLKRSYRFWRGLLRACTYRMQVEWQTPFTGEPAVFICNHAGALGPIDICAKFPLADHIHPWMNAQVICHTSACLCASGLLVVAGV